MSGPVIPIWLAVLLAPIYVIRHPVQASKDLMRIIRGATKKTK